MRWRGSIGVPSTIGVVRRECQARLDDLELPSPFSAMALAEQLSTTRGRRIRIVLVDVAAAGQVPCGAWLATDDEDVIFAPASTTPVHREHIVLHELCHMICGHAGVPGEDVSLARYLPDLDPAMVRRVLGRHAYGSRAEVEAEMLASMISRTALTPSRVGASGVLRRLRSALTTR